MCQSSGLKAKAPGPPPLPLPQQFFKTLCCVVLFYVCAVVPRCAVTGCHTVQALLCLNTDMECTRTRYLAIDKGNSGGWRGTQTHDIGSPVARYAHCTDWTVRSVNRTTAQGYMRVITPPYVDFERSIAPPSGGYQRKRGWLCKGFVATFP